MPVPIAPAWDLSHDAVDPWANPNWGGAISAEVRARKLPKCGLKSAQIAKIPVPRSLGGLAIAGSNDCNTSQIVAPPIADLAGSPPATASFVVSR